MHYSLAKFSNLVYLHENCVVLKSVWTTAVYNRVNIETGSTGKM